MDEQINNQTDWHRKTDSKAKIIKKPDTYFKKSYKKIVWNNSWKYRASLSSGDKNITVQFTSKMSLPAALHKHYVNNLQSALN